MALLLGFVLGVVSSIVATALTGAWTRWTPSRRRRTVIASAVVLGVGAVGFGVVAAIRAARDPETLRVTVQARAPGQGTWSSSVLARPADVVSFRLLLKNPGPGTTTNVIARVNQAPNHSFVCGSIQRFNSPDSPGEFVTGKPRACAGKDLIGKAGIPVGKIAEDKTVIVQWEEKIDKDPPRRKALHTVGVGRPEGRNEVYNTASVSVEPGR